MRFLGKGISLGEEVLALIGPFFSKNALTTVLWLIWVLLGLGSLGLIEGIFVISFKKELTDSRVTHLTRCVSDHCSVLLEKNPSNSVFLPRPFKFQIFWLSDVSFLGIVKEAWGWTRSLRESIENFSRRASVWNKDHLGNIFGKKKRVMARLNNIQKAIAIHPSHSLLELEKVLHKDLNTLLDQEEELWV